MAATKIFPITATEIKALTYIANPEKTDNSRLIITSGCSTDPNQASRDFDEIRARGTGLNTVLSQHFIQSFSPGRGSMVKDVLLDFSGVFCAWLEYRIWQWGARR